METVLITGVAGFIGSFLAKRVLEHTDSIVIGYDNLNDYYDVQIKRDRLDMLGISDGSQGRFVFIEAGLEDASRLLEVFDLYRPAIVVNLAAQAGVRYSVENPMAYASSNVVGFLNVLEACRRYPVKHLLYASSSSVYGKSSVVPYSVSAPTDSPTSFYAVTKKCNELTAFAYGDLFEIPTTGLRFFTVYGPMGRPDMAYFKFADKIVAGDPIEIYNHGRLRRDFTYIDDIITGLMKIIESVSSSRPVALSRLYNIGNSEPVGLLCFVDALESALIEEGVTKDRAIRKMMPMQIGDVYETYADVTELERDFGFRPSTRLDQGLRSFVRWYKDYRLGKR